MLLVQFTSNHNPRLANSSYNIASAFPIPRFLGQWFQQNTWFVVSVGAFKLRGSRESEESMREAVCLCVLLGGMGRLFNTLKILVFIFGSLEDFCSVFWWWLELFPKLKVVAFPIFWQQPLINGSPSQSSENQCIECMLNSRTNYFWSCSALWSISVSCVQSSVQFLTTGTFALNNEVFAQE